MAHEDTGLGSRQPFDGQPGSLECLVCDFDHDAMLRINGFNLDLWEIEEAGIECGNVIFEEMRAWRLDGVPFFERRPKSIYVESILWNSRPRRYR